MMETVLRPILEIAVILPGMLLSLLPMVSYLKHPLWKVVCRILPLLVGLPILGGVLCYWLNWPTLPFIIPIALVTMVVYIKILPVSIWKSGSIALAVCAIFACLNNFSRAIDAALIPSTESELWFGISAGLIYNGVCWLFALLAWYPASHAARKLTENINFAQTWYFFWIIPLVFIGLNAFITPRHRSTLYTGRILIIYIVMSLVLLGILVLFYAIFLMMANSLNRNAKLQQENHFLSLQQARYDNLRTAIEEARQARHDMRHHFHQLSALAEDGNLDKIKEYLSGAEDHIPNLEMCFCENRVADSVIGYYCTLAQRERIPFCAKMDLPEQLPVDEIDMCLVLSNLLENALEASLKTEKEKRQIKVEGYLHSDYIVLIQVENSFAGTISEKNNIFQSTKRKGNGVGIQSVRRIAEKSGGASTFTYQDGIFTAKVMLRGNRS